MNARTLFDAGRLEEAIEALGVELRDNPTDVRRRTFLFELLCFAGRWDRAEKQLDVIADGSREAGMGALVYRSALHAERVRTEMFESGAFPVKQPPPRPVSGMLNGKRFEQLEDLDPRVGARLEVFAAGQYTWLPFEHVSIVRMQAPKQLRDLLWAQAKVKPGPGFETLELGDVVLPVLTPLAWRSEDDAVRLGRVTEIETLDEGTEIPAGQKMLLVDGEAFPILEVRDLEIDPPSGT